DPAASVSEPIEKISIETSHPQWLIERWSDQFGFEEAAAMARANNEPAAISFRLTAKALRGHAKSPAAILGELRAAGAGLTESTIAPGAWRLRNASDCEDAGKDA